MRAQIPPQRLGMLMTDYRQRLRDGWPEGRALEEFARRVEAEHEQARGQAARARKTQQSRRQVR